jgi:hypothetical protein
MENTDDRVRHAAVAMADTIEEWPDTTWEDIRATNEGAGWVDARNGEADAGAVVLGPEELRAAWDLARELAADMPEQEYL